MAAAHPPPAPPEPLRAAALRPLIDAVLQQALCAIVTASVPEQGPVELTGFSIGPAALLDQIAGATGGARELRWHGEAVKAPLCAAVEAIRPVLTPPGVSGLALDVPGGLSLREGDPIQPRIVLPGFPAFLRVDDILSDGTLVHLYPSLASTGPKGQTIAAQPDRLFAPREVFRLGLPGQARGGAGLPVYPAGEPFGTDLIVAIAATAPIGVLVGGNPAGNDEDEAGTAAYIAALAQYLAHLRPGGDRVEAAAVLVHTRP